MVLKKLRILAILICAMITFSCVYIVVPDDIDMSGGKGSDSLGWSALVTSADTLENGTLHVEVTIRNDTGDWSKMEALTDKPAVLETEEGDTINCDTIIISTGGHRLAPGFQMRGYSMMNADQVSTQLLYVECNGVDGKVGSELTVNYESFQGDLDDYAPDGNKQEGELKIELGEIKTNLVYPIAESIDGLILQSDQSITALSENVVTLKDIQRSDTGFQFTWQNFNPSKFPLKTHIGTPPVIGEAGIIYGVYETLDMVDVPITPALENMEWLTEVTVPLEEKGFYILLSVESKKPRTYVNYAIDISDK
jgi:hypothetical protein